MSLTFFRLGPFPTKTQNRKYRKSSELSCCFAGGKNYRWMQKMVKIRHFIFKTKSLAPTDAMSFNCKVTTPTIMHSGIAIRQVAH
jgi:hypothetical protein